MRPYSGQHRFYRGVDIHTRTLAPWVLDAGGKVALRATAGASPQAGLDTRVPYRDGEAVACECMFARCWLADLCSEQGTPFVLGHALSRKAIHGGKTDCMPASRFTPRSPIRQTAPPAP
jgi:hypothetical protein